MTLSRNLLFSLLRNIQNRSKTIANVVPQTIVANRTFFGVLNIVTAQENLCANRTLFVTQTVRFSLDAVAISQLDYEHFCAETLESLCDYFEELVESVNHLAAADVVNKDGVLTVSLGSTYGTYVINKQSPNKQIWLSSPMSGPKRYDFVYVKNAKNGNKKGYWVYKHTGETLHELLDKELTEIIKKNTQFQSLSFGSKC